MDMEFDVERMNDLRRLQIELAQLEEAEELLVTGQIARIKEITGVEPTNVEETISKIRARKKEISTRISELLVEWENRRAARSMPDPLRLLEMVKSSFSDLR